MPWTIRIDSFSGLATIYDGHNVVAQDVRESYAQRIVEAVDEKERWDRIVESAGDLWDHYMRMSPALRTENPNEPASS